MGTITQLPSRPEPKPESLRERDERACKANPKLRAELDRAEAEFIEWTMKYGWSDPEAPEPDFVIRGRRRRSIRLLRQP